MFCGDLSGCLVKVASSTGHVLETRSLNKPVFADLLLLKNGEKEDIKEKKLLSLKSLIMH